MRKSLLLLLVTSAYIFTQAQKKQLDHSVYDNWQSIGNRIISNDGKWIVYNINMQEGDDELVIQSTDNLYKKIIPRGYEAQITQDSKSVAFKIKPLFKEIRQAKIKKKKPEDMPKDTFALIHFGKEDILKFPELISYKLPKDQNEWVACLLRNKEKKKAYEADKTKDSLQRVIDSLSFIINNLKGARPQNDETGKDSLAQSEKNNRLLLINTATGTQVSFSMVSDYVFNKSGSELLMEQNIQGNNTTIACIILYHLAKGNTDTLLKGGNDFKSLTLSDDGSRAAFVAERDAKPKALLKFYKLWYYQQGMDSAIMLVDTLTKNLPKDYTVSEFGKLDFSKSGKRLIFGTAPIKPAKDTSIADIDKVNVDIWNYKDDYLQPSQLENRKKDLEKNYLAVYDLNNHKMLQAGSEYLPTVYQTGEGDGEYFVAVTDTGRRVESQWIGRTKKDIYRINMNNGKYTLVKKNLEGQVSPDYISPSGKFITWYDSEKKNYFIYDGSAERNLTGLIKVPLYDEDNDVPNYPSPYGIMGWEDGDKAILIYDRYDIWKVDPTGKINPQNITVQGRKNKLTYRYIQTDPEEKFITSESKNLLHVFNNENKKSGIAILENNKLSHSQLPPRYFSEQPFYFDSVKKAKDAQVYTYTRESYIQSPDLYVFKNDNEQKLSNINTQQSQYNWGNASLYYWKIFSGKQATGTLYKPEDFDSTKKYPLILYFYEKLSDNLYRYIPPAPTPSRLNISFFVSRGYIVMAPDISYTIGHPAKSAYDYIVSGAKDLAKHNWIDASHMGIQGQSWGGIQVAQLVTMTPIFAAAWAGAPVANMTSAYGGIRWKGGVNRQFQYEKTQSRIGATLWQRPDLYIENSPLFHLPKVTTPLVIMANDNDGAVPWYQGIELFTGMRRLGKKVWMLNYNGEEHNLVQRRNRKDISIREQQFFDWLLKGAKPAKWLIEGVPAIEKGIDTGLELEK